MHLSLSIKFFLIAFILSGFALAQLHAEIIPNALFSDGAVLQRDQTLPIWGTAREGEKIHVQIADQNLSTIAKNGTWRVDCKPLKAGGPYTLTLSGDNILKIHNLFIGEVWICSGQSNMEFSMHQASNASQETPKAEYPQIRMFTVPHSTATKPRSELRGNWIECSPVTVGDFSAVGYFFARDLHQKLGVPIGMIHSSQGGTPAQSWISLHALRRDPELHNYHQAASTLPPLLEAQATAEAMIPRETELFNAMIHPLIPYAIRGVIWYQGESNVMDSKHYLNLFPALIADWRHHWQQGNFPFLFVQIAPFAFITPELRESQFLTLWRSQNTAMVVTTDIGNPHDIHPPQKEPVGQRLAITARALAYRENIEYSGPLYQSIHLSGGSILIGFSHIGSGLVAKDGPLRGFTIAGASGDFQPATANIEGNYVRVSSPKVKWPRAVRYGWENVPDLNLFNSVGLPASPFRTGR